MTKRLIVTLFLLSFAAPGARAQTITTFEGMDASQLAAPEFDFDPNGAVGTKQYMEWVNPYSRWLSVDSRGYSAGKLYPTPDSRPRLPTLARRGL